VIQLSPWGLPREVESHTGAPERVAWPELLYRFGEHLKWEPARKGQSVAAFYARMRGHEVPLTFLFSLMLAWASTDTICELLRAFAVEGDGMEDRGLHLCRPYDAGYTQPDVCLLSETARVFVELKWSTSIKLDQVQKYLALHADFDARFGRRKPYLLFLTREAFGECWRPRRAASDARPAPSFLREIVTEADRPAKLMARLGAGSQRHAGVVDEIGYGFATWRDVRDALDRIVRRWETVPRAVEAAMIEGFVADLERRLRG